MPPFHARGPCAHEREIEALDASLPAQESVQTCRTRRACGDNAAMESFFALLRKNVLDRQRWSTRERLRLAIITWIERTYHRRRRRRGQGRLSPSNMRQLARLHTPPEPPKPRSQLEPSSPGRVDVLTDLADGLTPRWRSLTIPALNSGANERHRRLLPMPPVLGHPSGGKLLLLDVRQSASSPHRADIGMTGCAS